MNKLATVTFTTVMVELPAGKVAAGYTASLFKDADLVAQVMNTLDTDPVQFTIDAAGTYHVEVVRAAADGTDVAPAARSDDFVVTAEQVAVPQTVTVSVVDVQP